ncbi:MAG: hypothetical protein ACJ74Y_15565 [Bryobacteraceae bacterium]
MKVLGAIVLVSVLVPFAPSAVARMAEDERPLTPAEIKRIITDSPWAKPVLLRMNAEDWPPRDSRPRADSAGGMGAEGAPARTNPGGGIQNTATGEARGSTDRLRSVVRWDSAAPVREACARAGMESYSFSCYSKIMFVSGQAEKFDTLAKEFYILTVSDYPEDALPRRDRDLPQHSSAANTAFERLGERIKAKTLLKRKGKENIAPEKVIVLPAGQTLLVIAFFPRSASVNVQDGSVVFESIRDPVVIRARFNLTKMVLNGKLEL